MKHLYKRLLLYLVSLCLIILVVVLSIKNKPTELLPEAPANFDFNNIKERGKLIAIVDKNSVDYFIYNGKVQGFQLEILRKFSEHLNLNLEIIVQENYDSALYMLSKGQCDIVASNITILKERRKGFTFSSPIMQTKQVLIQRKNAESNPCFINSVLDLAHKTVHIKTNSASHNRLINLAEEIGDSIYITDNLHYTTEALIKKVSTGEIDYTFANEHIAKLNARYYPNIDISLAVSFEQNTAWIIRNNAPVFEDTLNNWLNNFIANGALKSLYYKYFESERQLQVFTSEYSSLNGNKISEYDKIIKKHAPLINWDWRLIASLIYQESRFNAQLISRRGASGLMQLMPITAQKYNVDSNSTADENIKAGILSLKWINSQLASRVKDDNERIKFTLASYNVGLGHIYDAQSLAKKYGKNPQIWTDNVEYYIYNKSNPVYLNDSLVRNGSIRGRETVALVKKVMERYHHYKNLIKD